VYQLVFRVSGIKNENESSYLCAEKVKFFTEVLCSDNNIKVLNTGFEETRDAQRAKYKPGDLHSSKSGSVM